MFRITLALFIILSGHISSAQDLSYQPRHYHEIDGEFSVNPKTLEESYAKWAKTGKKSGFSIPGLDLEHVKCLPRKNKICHIEATVWFHRNGGHLQSELSLNIYYNQEKSDGLGPFILMELKSTDFSGKYHVYKNRSEDHYLWLEKYQPCCGQLSSEAKALMTLFQAITLYYK